MTPRMDRRIRIEQKVATRDTTYGSETVSWAHFETVDAEWLELAPSRSESVRMGLEVARNQVRVRFRYLTGLDSSMRVVLDNVAYNVVGGPAEIGRKEWHEVVLERYSS